MYLLFLDSDASYVQVEVAEEILARILQHCFHLSLGKHFALIKLFKTIFKDFVTAAYHLVDISTHTVQDIQHLPEQMHDCGRCLIIQRETATKHEIVDDVVCEPF